MCEQPNVDIVGGEARQNVLAFYGHRSGSMDFHSLIGNLIGSGISTMPRGVLMWFVVILNHSEPN